MLLVLKAIAREVGHQLRDVSHPKFAGGLGIQKITGILMLGRGNNGYPESLCEKLAGLGAERPEMVDGHLRDCVFARVGLTGKVWHCLSLRVFHDGHRVAALWDVRLKTSFVYGPETLEFCLERSVLR